ncbi:MAG: hypothetical protein L3J82_05000 [Planctomycetes bacterium]|nr:hypothetical protein [Planctomycetota bacterium]
MSNSKDSIWVGVEVARPLSLYENAGALTVGGVNLLRHQLKIALEIADAENVFILTPQADENVLEANAEFDCSVLGPIDFITKFADKARSGDAGVILQLRQTAPIQSVSLVREALLLAPNGSVVSASKPPDGHKRHQPLPDMTEPDYRCLAFEARPTNAFGLDVLAQSEEKLAWIEWGTFAEINRPSDLDAAAKVIESWA